MNTKVVIGVDIGTTSTKTLAYNLEGEIWAEKEKEYPIYSKKPDWKEQDPNDILQAVEETFREVASTVYEKGGKLTGVGFSAAMHSIMAVQENGVPLTNSLTWADQRAVKESEALNASVGASIFSRTGTPIHPMSPLAKIMWYQNNLPETAAMAAKWISIKEFILYNWFGKYVVDYSIASASGLFNLEKKTWDEEALQTAGISKMQLSEPVSTTYILKGLKKEARDRLQVPADLPFVIGASDGVLANVGAGALKRGSVACSIGTSGAVRTVVDKPYFDPKGRIFCYVLTDSLWVIGGPINNGGIALRWMRDKIFPELKEQWQKEGTDPYEKMTEMAADVGPGAGGLLFLPYLSGERAPFWNSDTKGVFFGLTLHHGRKQMVRSVMEGVMLQMYSVVVALIEAGVELKEFRAGGGFAQSALWKQMMADIFETDIVVPKSHQGSCFGAAWLAMVALGLKGSLEEIEDYIPLKAKLSPIQENVTAYRDIKPIFLRLARNLSSEFEAISDVQRAHAAGKRTMGGSERGEVL